MLASRPESGKDVSAPQHLTTHNRLAPQLAVHFGRWLWCSHRIDKNIKKPAVTRKEAQEFSQNTRVIETISEPQNGNLVRCGSSSLSSQADAGGSPWGGGQPRLCKSSRPVWAIGWEPISETVNNNSKQVRGNKKRQRLEDKGNMASGILSPLLQPPDTAVGTSFPCSGCCTKPGLCSCPSACLTHSEWWRRWVPYWRWLGSSGPQSQPVAWSRHRAGSLKAFTVLIQHTVHGSSPQILTFEIPQLCQQLRSQLHHLWEPTRKCAYDSSLGEPVLQSWEERTFDAWLFLNSHTSKAHASGYTVSPL